MTDSLTQGTEEGGASALPTKELYVKSRHDWSTYRAATAHLACNIGDGAGWQLPPNIPAYASTEDARKDRDFKGGYFWVRPPVAYAHKAVTEPIRVLRPGEEFVVSGASTPPKDTNPKTIFGEAKPSLSLLPGPALIEVAMAMREGKAKYGSMNWREDPVSSTTYADAGLRHLFQWIDGEDRCPKSGAYHLAHLAANALILLDAMLQGTLIDDRPPAGTTSKSIDANTRDIRGVPSEAYRTEDTQRVGWAFGQVPLRDHPRSTPHAG